MDQYVIISNFRGQSIVISNFRDTHSLSLSLTISLFLFPLTPSTFFSQLKAHKSQHHTIHFIDQWKKMIDFQ